MSTTVIPVSITPFTMRHIPHPVNRLASGIDVTFGPGRSLPSVVGDPYTTRLRNLGVPAKGVTTREKGVSVYLAPEVVASEDSLAEAKDALLKGLKTIFGPSYDFKVT